MKYLFLATLCAVLSLFTPSFALAASPGCSVNWVNGDCGAPSNGNAAATTTTICKDGTVVHHRHDAGANCPNCSKEKRV